MYFIYFTKPVFEMETIKRLWFVILMGILFVALLIAIATA